MSQDFRITDHGSLVLFLPLTPAAIKHAEDHFPDDCPTMGRAYAVESRYAPAIVADLDEQGFILTGEAFS